MSDNDLIRRGDALQAVAGWEIPSTAIAALPAVTVKANLQLVRDCRDAVNGKGPRAYDWSDKPHRLIYDLCREIERLAALDLTPAPLRYMGQIMAECDCPREAECQAAGRCIAEERK